MTSVQGPPAIRLSSLAGLNKGRVSSQANAVVQAAIEMTDTGAKTASAAAASAWLGSAASRRSTTAPVPASPVQHSYAERLMGSTHVDVRV